MASQYTLVGPPFNFLGTFTESQWAAFKAWITDAKEDLPDTQLHHRIRAQQLRKTQGLLEKFYATVNDEVLGPTFQKQAWQPDPQGHFLYPKRDDHVPAMAVGKIKERFATRLQRQDEAIFHMNHLRAQIERQEDLAQYAAEAPDTVTALLAKVDALFDLPEYQTALVKDQSDQYQGEPRFRVHPLDAPTAWERAVHNRVAL